MNVISLVGLDKGVVETALFELVGGQGEVVGSTNKFGKCVYDKIRQRLIICVVITGGSDSRSEFVTGVGIGWRYALVCFLISDAVFLLSSHPRIDVELMQKLRVIQEGKNLIMDSLSTLLVQQQCSEDILERCLKFVKWSYEGAPNLHFLFVVDNEILQSWDQNALLQTVSEKAASLNDELLCIIKRARVSVQGSHPLYLLDKVGVSLLVPHPCIKAEDKYVSSVFDFYKNGTPIADFVSYWEKHLNDDVLHPVKDVEMVIAMWDCFTKYVCTSSQSATQCLQQRCGEFEGFSWRVPPGSRGLVEALRWMEACEDPLYAYSARKCELAMQSAYEQYLTSVPETYTERKHEQALKTALKAYDQCAIGPAACTYGVRLEESCCKYWQSGHERCSRFSLTGRCCSLAPHSLSIPHTSATQFFCSSGSGEDQQWVTDPYDLLSANQSWEEDEKHSICGLQFKLWCVDLGLGKDLQKVPSECNDQGEDCGEWGAVYVVGRAREFGSREASLRQPGFLNKHSSLYCFMCQASFQLTQEVNLDLEFPELGKELTKKKKEVVEVRRKMTSEHANVRNWPTIPYKPDSPRHSANKVLEVPRKLLENSKYGRTDRERGKDSTVLQNLYRNAVKTEQQPIFIGFEYESLAGNRFYLSPSHLGTKDREKMTPDNSNSARYMLSRDIPLYVEMSLEERKRAGSGGVIGGDFESNTGYPWWVCQLKRIIVVTPPEHIKFYSWPKIVFECLPSAFVEGYGSRMKGMRRMGFLFSTAQPISLPPSSVCVIKLPWVYSVPKQYLKHKGWEGMSSTPLIMQSASKPFQTYLLKGSPMFPA